MVGDALRGVTDRDAVVLYANLATVIEQADTENLIADDDIRQAAIREGLNA